jgi:hypothetical protein
MNHGCVELRLVVRVRVPLRIPSLQVMGKLDTFSENELQLTVTGH